MSNMTVPAVLFFLVFLILLGQWLVVRRAKSMRGQPVPEELLNACQSSVASSGSAGDAPQNLEELNALVAFDSPNCGACRKMEPVLKDIAEQYPGRVFSLSVTNHRHLAQTLRIMGTPTMLVVQDGRIVDVFVGITPMSRLMQRLQQVWPASSEHNG